MLAALTHPRFLAGQGDMGARRAAYEARWHTFISSAAPDISYQDVPWLLQDQEDAKVMNCTLLLTGIVLVATSRHLHALRGLFHHAGQGMLSGDGAPG